MSTKESTRVNRAEAKLRHVEIATTNRGPRDDKRYLRTREHAEGIDAPARGGTTDTRTTARTESADARTMSPNAQQAEERQGYHDRDDNEPTYR